MLPLRSRRGLVGPVRFANAVLFLGLVTLGAGRARGDEPLAGPSFGEGRVEVHQGPEDSCISPAQREAVEREVAANVAMLGPMLPRGPAGSYTFWPQAGTLGRDLFMNNFVDLNATAAIQDYACGDWTYNGHAGHDIDLRSFSEQLVGVPIFAALDGTVTGRADGNPDMNTVWSNQPANYVILDHGGGHQTWYWHMKLGSVAVSLGQFVRAGQQLGLTGSSGISTGPHLHFESRVGSAAYESFSGACRAGTSGWSVQPNPDRTTTYLRDFGFTNVSMSSYAGPPQPYPRASHAAFSDSLGYYWMQGHNLPTGAQFQFKFFRPNGTLYFASTPGAPSWATAPYRWWWAWYSWNLPEMRTTAGTWQVQVLINSVVMVDTPIEVKAVSDPLFNRAPSAVTLAFDPPVPTASAPVFCRVTSGMVLDDPDFDVVRYRYVWRAGGVIVRDVTSAALSDAIPAGAVVAHRPVVCTVTPSDGLLSGPATTINSCRADYDNSGELSVQDIFDFLNAWFVGSPSADVNGGGLSVQDIFDYLNLWFAGC